MRSETLKEWKGGISVVVFSGLGSNITNSVCWQEHKFTRWHSEEPKYFHWKKYKSDFPLGGGCQKNISDDGLSEQ